MTFALTSCTTTSTKNSENVQKNVASQTPHQVLTVQTKTSDLAKDQQSITLNKVMSDPDWIGRAPESWYWGDDSNSIFFNQKRIGSPVNDLFQIDLDKEKEITKVNLGHLHTVSDRYAKRNAQGTHEVYAYKGNIFLKSLASNQVIQLTYTSAIETSPMFLTNGDVAYRIKNKFYRHVLTSNQIVELASLKLSSNPDVKTTEQSYIAKEQSELIEYIAKQQRNRKLKSDQTEQLKAQNSTITKTEFYLGKGYRVVHASLSPVGDKMIVSITNSETSRKNSDIMPNYIAEDGHVKAEKVRARVADNHQYSEELLLLDLRTGQKFPLSFEQLTGHDEDVLAKVKQENHQRKGLSYQAKTKPRNIHVIRNWQPIKWQADGRQVAVMLEAWDNKDRWIASINLLENKLETQHRLHDQAWVNWAFNEFGWLGNSGKLYYLSEESGYSHLYTKTLKGKAKQLTVGNYEVSDLTISKNEQTIYFKANKKHPGIYEVYSIGIDGNGFKRLTNLDGMIDYALSPDESKLLLAHSTVTMPTELFVKSLEGEVPAHQITHTVSEEFKAMPWAVPSVVAIPSSYQEQPIYARVYLPKDYDKKKEKLRAVMFSHGAGYLQNAHLGWSLYFREFMFHSMLVQQGYVVIDMDYRASKGYGRDWRTAIYRHMGKPEVQDMLDGVSWLVENANVDPNRVGTYGGSYGGFLTLMALFTEPNVFQSGAALRLVSDWAYYNHGYTSNILNTPKDDAIAYERSSPIYFAEGLTKPLLMNAPMIDSNVFFQDTVRLVQRLIELEKENFETAIYPVEPHGFIQPSSWLDEYRRIYRLFEKTL